MKLDELKPKTQFRLSSQYTDSRPYIKNSNRKFFDSDGFPRYRCLDVITGKMTSIEADEVVEICSTISENKSTTKPKVVLIKKKK